MRVSLPGHMPHKAERWMRKQKESRGPIYRRLSKTYLFRAHSSRSNRDLIQGIIYIIDFRQPFHPMTIHCTEQVWHKHVWWSAVPVSNVDHCERIQISGTATIQLWRGKKTIWLSFTIKAYMRTFQNEHFSGSTIRSEYVHRYFRQISILVHVESTLRIFRVRRWQSS